MNSVENTWNKIISALKVDPMELATVPSNRREPLWFKVYMEKGILYVDNAVYKNPSTRMSQRRKISKDDFLTVYAFYHRWANGETHLRDEVRQLSRNTAYIFALISEFE